MNEQTKAQIHQHVQALYRYSNALEHGDGETVSAVLEEASQDQALERMILEFNEVYQIEDRAIVHPDDVAIAREMLLDVFAEVRSEQAPATLVPAISKGKEQTQQRQLGVAPAHPVATRRQDARKWQRSRPAALVAVALLAVLLISTLSAFAPQLLALFRPQQFTAVSSTAFQDPGALVNGLDSFLRQFGDNTTANYTSKSLTGPTLSQSAAEQQAHFHIQLPSVLPAGAGHTPLFAVTPADQETFTFNATKARAYLQKTGQTGVSLPTQLDGASFEISLASGVIVTYSTGCTQVNGKQQCSGGTPTTVTEVPDPTIQAAGGASLNDLRGFLLSLPKLPATIRTLLQHADVDNGIVPVPLPARASSEQTTIHGARALLVTLSGNAGIIWEAQNIVYILLAANTSSTQIQAVANSLK